MRLSGRVAIVTGAASGIGRATALRLAREGAEVVLVDRNEQGLARTAAEIAAPGRTPLVVGLDVARRSEVVALVDRVTTTYGRIDMLVTCAAVNGAGKPTWAWSEDEIDQILSVNLKGVVFCLQAVLGLMRQQQRGAIVNVSSVTGRLGVANKAIYSGSKAAVEAISVSLAKEVAGDGIRVNCVAPGYIDTPMTAPMTDPTRRATLARIPLGRAGRAEEVAAVIAFLCSDDASYVTGQTYDVSGGRSVF